jgi:hypothetical protein
VVSFLFFPFVSCLELKMIVFLWGFCVEGFGGFWLQRRCASE